MRPAYGVGSERAHAAGGAWQIDPSGLDSLRTDVDDLGSLAAALSLGCGPRTTAYAWALTLEPAR
jgi:2-phospho-L-lactate guanylyltransferase